MTENQNQPREYDAVLGGESPPSLDAVVLGGIPGVKSRLASPAVEVRITALSEALKYGEAGLELIIKAWQNESIKVKAAAYSLLQREYLKKEFQLQDYLPTFNFDVITVDAEGKENSRHSSSARFFSEDLGNGVVLEMVYIPGGTFMMGSPATEEDRGDIESPQRQVTVPAFYAGKYPITQAQWQAMMENNPSVFIGEKYPVEFVSWNMAIQFCAKLSQTTGKKYRLLSEAEWEYACRADTTTPFHFGETITPDLVNYNGKMPYKNAPKGLYRKKTTDVGSFPPNAFGLYDMHGNVAEWCSNRWHENYSGAPTDGSSWQTGRDNDCMLRGGSWDLDAVYCLSAYRYWRSANDRWWTWGFRVAIASLSL